MSELLPCPFCGGSAERIDIDDGENAGGSCISCTRCQASSNLEFGYKENFVSNWNRRAGPAMTPDLREAVTDLLLNAGCGDSNECEAIADAILSLPALSVPEGWRPIETAPRDGTDLLVYWPRMKIDDAGNLTGEQADGPGWIGVSRNEFGGWEPDSVVEANGDWFDDDFEFGEPTHWMPRPAPPLSAIPSPGGENAA